MIRTLCLLLALVPVAGCQHSARQFKDGLISQSYGIVTDYDIKTNAKIAHSVDKTGEPFLVWQCFQIDRVQMHCEDMGEHPENGGSSATPILEVWRNQRRIEFYLPHAWSAERCADDLSKWREIIRVGQPACFSGFFDPTTGAVADLRVVKTRNGKWSYFLE